MLRVSVRALRRARLSTSAVPKSSGALSVRAGAGVQRRSMGFFSDLKNQLKNEMEKNEELKKSFEELGKAKESVEKEIEKAKESVEKATKEKMHDVEEAAKHASQKLKDSYQDNVKAAAAAKAEEEEKEKSEEAAAGAEAGGQGEKTEEKGEEGAKPSAEEEVRSGLLVSITGMVCSVLTHFVLDETAGTRRELGGRALVREERFRQDLGPENQDRQC